ncbi:hypothetical protein L580_1630 [Serratia fonticola AU-P3(3)]|nr:hypothetical protein L580_1630 [Serratia fonticola AU-P3(3)]
MLIGMVHQAKRRDPPGLYFFTVKTLRSVNKTQGKSKVLRL